MKALTFAKRNFKEIVRDPISLVFCFILPLFLLFIFQQFQIPDEVYKLENFAPGIIIFSFGFISLFGSQLIAKDRSTSFLTRLFSSPLKVSDYILGYTISLVPVAFLQSLIFLIAAILLGMTFSINIIYTLLISIFLSLMFIALGILIGCTFTEKQAPGFGSIVIQLIAFTSGLWFSIDTVSGAFKAICEILPFKYTVDLARYSLSGNFTDALKPILMVIGFTILIYFLAVYIFKKKMTSDSK